MAFFAPRGSRYVWGWHRSQRRSGRQILGVGVLGGIGFTMSTFMAGLAFAGQPLLEIAKLGIFAASLVAGGTGFLLLFKSNNDTSQTERMAG